MNRYFREINLYLLRSPEEEAGLSFSDFISEGNLRLVKASRKFDENVDSSVNHPGNSKPNQDCLPSGEQVFINQ